MIIKTLVNNYVIHMEQTEYPPFELVVCDRCGEGEKVDAFSFQWTGKTPGGEQIDLCRDCLFTALDDYNDWLATQ